MSFLHAIKEFPAQELKKTTTRITTRDGKVYEERPSSSSEEREQVFIGQGVVSSTFIKISDSITPTHGLLANREWQLPIKVVDCELEARPVCYVFDYDHGKL